MGSTRKMSLNNSSMSYVSSSNTEVPPSPGASFVSEFGGLDGATAPEVKSATAKTRQSGIPASLSKRPIPRESISYNTGLRKSSSNSVASLATSSEVSGAAAATAQATSRLSALSPSKNKLLSPKPSDSPRSGRQSLSTPSPVQSVVDEDEMLGDEEMMAYIKRTQARKLANGARKEDLDEMLKFPEPSVPVPGSSPNCKPAPQVWCPHC